jgi:hypothetical protein
MIHRRKLTITLKAPWMTQGNLVGTFGIDAPLARTAEGTLCLPGTLIIGKLAEGFRQLAALGAGQYGADLASVFAHEGAGDNAAKTAREGRRRIFIGDLMLVTPVTNSSGIRTRVAIDPVEGNASEGALQVMEAPLADGADAVFVGELRLIAPEADGKAILDRVERALSWIAQFGGERTIGFGVASAVKLCESQAIPKIGGAPTQERLRLRFKLHDLLCVGDLRTSSNTYMSAAVIPGGAIKGAIAHQILAGLGKTGSLNALKNGPFPNVAKHFSALRISHAFPVVKDCGNVDRPRRLPHSWAVANEVLHDQALLDDPSKPVLVANDVPNFSPDWKGRHWGMAENAVGWSEPATELRLRTQIDPDKRAAMESRLFAIGYRHHHTHDWVADVNFTGDDADREAVYEELLTVLGEGLAGIGRGGAFATVTCSEPPAQNPLPEAGRVIMTLQTPALLRCPVPEKTGNVTDDYANAFTSLCLPGKLKAIFIREQLRGAAFMAEWMGNAYQPWLLTEPGSVFVFEGVTDVAPFEALLKTGLGIPAKTLGFYGLKQNDQLWKKCPWLPENGYGEVAFGQTGTVGAPPEADVQIVEVLS